jgi:hypothetical protein
VCTLPNNRPTNGRSAGGRTSRARRRLPGLRQTRLRLTVERAAALIYTGTSFVVALAFWLVTTFTGDFTNVARWGGAAWIFLLMMIVLMPIVIPWMKRRERAEEPAACPLPAPDSET